VLLPSVLGLERVEDPVGVVAHLEGVPGDCPVFCCSEVTAGLKESGEIIATAGLRLE
jgi:hypothetical protein